MPNSFSTEPDQRSLGLFSVAGRGSSVLGNDLVQGVDPVAELLHRHIVYIDQCPFQHSVKNILHGGFHGSGQMAQPLVMAVSYTHLRAHETDS